MPEIAAGRPADLIRRLRRLASQRNRIIVVQEGSRHTKITLNGRQTTIPRHAADLDTGLFHAIRKQLGLSPGDLE